jgi:hypothetical protein
VFAGETRQCRSSSADISADAEISASGAAGDAELFRSGLERRPRCGGTLKIIAALAHPTVMAKILTHLGWSIRAPPRATFAVIRSASKRPDSNRSPIYSGSAPEPTLSFDLHSRATLNDLEIWHRGPINRPKSPRCPDSRPRTRCLTTRLTQQYSSCRPKRVFIFPKRVFICTRSRGTQAALAK